MRATREDVLMKTAFLAATRSTCDRLAVGVVIARDGRILTTGYNGTPSGMDHCVHFENLDGRTDPPCLKAVHAEQNAIAFAARYGMATEGAEAYITHSPCGPCAKLLIQAGIIRVFYAQAFRDPYGLEMLMKAGVDVRGELHPWHP